MPQSCPDSRRLRILLPAAPHLFQIRLASAERLISLVGSATIRGHEDIPRLRALRRARAGRARSRRQGDAARAARIRHRARRGAESKDQRRRHAPLRLRAQADRRRPARRALPGRPVPLEGPHRGAGRRADDARLALLRRLATGHRRQRARQASQAHRPRLLRPHHFLRARTVVDVRAAALWPDPDAVGPHAHLGRLRIAWTAKTPNGAKVERESLDALAETVRLCTDLGHDVEAADPEIDGAAVVPTFLTLAAANTVVNLAGHPTGKKAGPSDVERVTWA